MMNCDPVTGVCLVPEISDKPASQARVAVDAPTVRYIGDPMCSWCWGISPTLKELAAYSQGHNLNFAVHVGGLRPGGGDPWNAQFKAFLRDEWETIQRVTGQKFGFSILDQAEFNYDTEPASRAVVVMANLLEKQSNSSQAVLEFFSAIQKKFYVDGADPKQPEFYRDLCAQAGVSFDDFLKGFHSEQAKAATVQEFQRVRSWGIRGFPSLVLDVGGKVTLLASGHTTTKALIEKIESLVGGRA